MIVRIYVEGGSEGSIKSNCRKAFATFFGKAIRKGSFKVIASGSRHNAYQDFCSALRQHSEDFVILLVDAEGAVTASPWSHLNWKCPPGIGVDQAHLMVQVMEAWFLADAPTLSTYYGQAFLRNSLPGQKDVEQIDKQTVIEALRHASRPTQKGAYHKTKHGFDLLELIDPGLVRDASRHAESLFAVLERLTRASG